MTQVKGGGLQSTATSFAITSHHQTSSIQQRNQTLASTSSPLTWMIGQLSAFATSVQYGELRLFLGSVVNATCTHASCLSQSDLGIMPMNARSPVV